MKFVVYNLRIDFSAPELGLSALWGNHPPWMPSQAQELTFTFSYLGSCAGCAYLLDLLRF